MEFKATHKGTSKWAGKNIQLMEFLPGYLTPEKNIHYVNEYIDKGESFFSAYRKVIWEGTYTITELEPKKMHSLEYNQLQTGSILKCLAINSGWEIDTIVLLMYQDADNDWRVSSYNDNGVIHAKWGYIQKNLYSEIAWEVIGQINLSLKDNLSLQEKPAISIPEPKELKNIIDVLIEID